MNSLLVLAGTLAGFILLEAALRVFPEERPLLSNQDIIWDHWRGDKPSDIQELAEVYNDFAMYDPLLGYIKRSMDFEERLFRIRDGYKVMLVGDSITGNGHYYRALITNIYEAHIGKRFNFINAGVGGWDTKQEFDYLRSRGVNYKPDLVVLQFCLNDFNITPVFWKGGDGKFFAYNAGHWGQYLNYNFISYSRLVQKLLPMLLQYFPQSDALDAEKVKNSLRGIDQLSREHGFDLRIVLFPYYRKPKKVDLKMHQMIRRIIKELSLSEKTIDLLDLPLEYDTTPWRLTPDDYVHPNDFGANIIAQKIVHKLPLQNN